MDRKGQRVSTPDGKGEVLETVGDEVNVKLDSGETKTFPDDDVADDSTAN
ncbi:hypothetical protein D0C36_04605 [Mucilaginibacter conchicola]|uniref:Myosin N-terminal SH3-like domain-containing protein n=1 Tax=Mucilaginibacter conchicola TaxID=2303333 RepID=A0A372NXI7_9SPHI|nr:myosin N-terminal SH3-like domain-containing protein [Mucilaginibacter conchicola]RFZ94820.1 hypothetical protein D0C36_04605 [Mucilaginibacter conchicola]